MRPDREQRRVLTGMAGAAVMAAAGLAWGGAAVAPLLPPMPTAGDRLAFAVRADLFLALPLALSIGWIARARFLSPDDIAGSARDMASARLAVPRAVLQNTLEQTVLALIVHLGLAAVLPARDMGVVAVLVALFLAGRLAFAIGYPRGAGARAFGFGLTFYPTLGALGWGLVRLVG